MIAEAQLYRLLAWLSPAFPVGAYSFSHGLEWAVEAGRVRDAESLAGWVAAAVTEGAGRIDAALFRAAWQAFTEGDEEALAWAAERAEAQRATMETALESRAQGRAFLDTVLAAWPDPALRKWADGLAAEGRQPAYAIAVAVAAASKRIPLGPALAAYLQAFAANLVSAGLRLIPLGQTDGQRVLARLESAVRSAQKDSLEGSLQGSLDSLGSAAPMIDWASARHETQYTRLFRS